MTDSWQNSKPKICIEPVDLTNDPRDPRLGHGINESPVPQHETYLILPEEARKDQPHMRPLRATYRHLTCDHTTTMAPEIAETYARNPKFYGATYCVYCQMHRPLSEFVWLDGNEVGS